MSRNAGVVSALVWGSAGPGSPGEGRGSARGKEQAPPGTWLAGARSSTTCLRQSHDCWVFPNWILRKGMHCHLVNKDVRWMKAFVFAQKSAKCCFSHFLLRHRKRKGQKWAGIVFRNRFCISVIMSQHFILSFFVLAPTYNADGRVAPLLPVPSNTQPKRCCFDQVLKNAGAPLPMYVP